jgi:glycine cleavage system H lipoate-binding protein
METMTGDLFATKGVEYLLVIAYLALLVAGWKLVFPKARTSGPAHRHDGPLPDGYLFHQGHSWAHPTAEGIVRVGIDDFAQHAIGLAARVDLPARGSVLSEGEPAWEVQHGNGDYIAMVSPVTGIVLDVNEDVLHAPGLLNTQPYDEGWLLEVQVASDAYRRNLLSGPLAAAWMAAALAAPREQALDQLLTSVHLSGTA